MSEYSRAVEVWVGDFGELGVQVQSGGAVVGLSLGASGDEAPCARGRVLTADCVVLRFRLLVLFIHQQPHGEMVCMIVALYCSALC